MLSATPAFTGWQLRVVRSPQGFHYDYDDHIGIDGSYAHIFFQDSNINI